MASKKKQIYIKNTEKFILLNVEKIKRFLLISLMEKATKKNFIQNLRIHKNLSKENCVLVDNNFLRDQD